MAEISAKYKKAEVLGITPGGTEEAELIHVIQEAEGHEPCFGKSNGQCLDTDCRFMQDCLAKTVGEFDFNAWLLPTLDLEQYKPNVEKKVGVKDEIKGSTRYAWIGVGQCGGRLVKSFYDLDYKKVLAVDTTHHDLVLLDIPQNQKFLMNIRQEGTGSDMERGQKAIRRHQHEVLHLARRTFGSQVDHIMICFGAGGATGSGSVIGLIEIAKRYARCIGLKNPDRKVGVVMTLPAIDRISSPLTAENAYSVACNLNQMATAGEISPLIIVDNDKINKMYPTMTTMSFWPSINSTFASLFDIFNRLSALSSCYTSFDPVDYHSIMEAGGCAIMGLAKVDELDDRFTISKAVKNNLEKTLLAGGFDLSTAKLAGCVVVGGKELMANVKGLQDNIDHAFDALSEITGQATIHRGIYEDDRNCLRVYTLIGGLDGPAVRLEGLSADSYYRPQMVNLEGPPLHQRKGDILPLAEYFLANQADFYSEPPKVLSPDAKKLLLNYDWPGNVGELANTIERAYVLTIGQEIQPAAMPFRIIIADSGPSREDLPSLDEVKRKIIAQALELTKGRKLAVAKILGIERRRLNHLIEKLNIPCDEEKHRQLKTSL